MSEFEDEEEMGSIALLLSLIFFIVPLLVILICLVLSITKAIGDKEENEK